MKIRPSEVANASEEKPEDRGTGKPTGKRTASCAGTGRQKVGPRDHAKQDECRDERVVDRVRIAVQARWPQVHRQQEANPQDEPHNKKPLFAARCGVPLALESGCRLAKHARPAYTCVLLLASLFPLAASATTYYVRVDGGTRYSTNVTTGQCNGTTDAAYPGSGVNQDCAFNDVRMLWTDCSYNDGHTFPGWGWIGSGGDTYLIEGSIADGVSYRVGYSGPNSGDYNCAVPGDPSGSGPPPILSGTSGNPTRVLGGNYASCSAQSARTQLHGGYGVGEVMNLSGTSYADVECLDLTDFSACGRSGQTDACSSGYPLSDYAAIGMTFNRTTTNVTVTNVRAHGLAGAGFLGPTGDGVVMNHIDILGNANAGWNADPGDGTTGTGTLVVQNFNISWNGCAEEYPIVDALPYSDCTDESSGGYGDGFGTATVASSPGWQATFDQGVASYNTQDGLDALHLTGTGSSMTITRTLAYGNMGQQMKIGGTAGTIENSLIVTNCNALRQAIPGTPSGYNTHLSEFCRASDVGIAVTVGDGSTTTLAFNTIYSASTTGIELDCGSTCTGTDLIDYRNNIFLGFLNNTANGYPSGGTGDYSNPITNDLASDPFANAGSQFSNNLTYHYYSGWTCPATDETHALCVDPQLTDETWTVYGYPSSFYPLTGSPVIGSGVTIFGITTDYAGATRPNPPSRGALEPLSISPPTHLTGTVHLTGSLTLH